VSRRGLSWGDRVAAAAAPVGVFGRRWGLLAFRRPRWTLLDARGGDGLSYRFCVSLSPFEQTIIGAGIGAVAALAGG
jgi:hypothetical protein